MLPRTRSEPPASPEELRRHQLLLWAVMLISIVAYFVVVQVVEAPEASENPGLVNGMFVAAVVMVALSLHVKGRFYAAAETNNKLEMKKAGMVAALVLCEAAALFGVVVHFLTGSPYSWVFLVLGFAGVLLHYPRR